MKNLPAISPTNITELENFARMAAASGFFSDTRDAAQAMVKIAAGLEIGIAPIQAMTSIHVIKGKISLSANLQAALVRRAGYRYQVQWQGEQSVNILFFDPEGQPLGGSSFSLDNAKRAGLSGGGWSKYPRNMLFARAMMNGVRWYVPEIGIGIYDPDEMGDTSHVSPLPEEDLPEVSIADEYDPADEAGDPADEDNRLRTEISQFLEKEESKSESSEASVTEAQEEDDGAYPGPVWNAANRGIMASLNSAGLTRDDLKKILGVDSLTTLVAKDLNLAAIKCVGYGYWNENLGQCSTISDLRTAWDSAVLELSGGWKALAAKAKDERKRELSTSP